MFDILLFLMLFTADIKDEYWYIQCMYLSGQFQRAADYICRKNLQVNKFWVILCEDWDSRKLWLMKLYVY